MTNEDIIRELKNVEKEYENKPTPTFSINLSSMARDCRKHIEQLAEELKKEQIFNSVIKQRLVEVNCDCNEEKKQACPMFPEYCEGEHKTVVDLLTLVSDGLNETLLKQKDDEISQLKAQIECEHKQYLEVRDKLEKQIEYNIELGRRIEKLRCCGNCKNVRYEWGEKVIEGICHECRNYNKWEMKE